MLHNEWPNGRIQVGSRGSIRGRVVAWAAALVLATAVVAGAARGPVPEAAARGTLGAVKLGTFDRPMYPAQAPGEPGLIFVVEQTGRVKLIDHGSTVAKPFLDIRDRVLAPGDPGGFVERGLLSIAFPPDFQTSRRFYVYFTNNDGDIEIDEFKRSAVHPHRANPTSRRQVIVIPHSTYANHNGGTMQFGSDGLLYFATGDGGGVSVEKGKYARDLHSLLGKLIRIDPLPQGGNSYGIPPSNPYVGRAGRNEIFAYGLRNPFRFTFDGGRIAIGDVGHHEWEEIDLVRLSDARGANFGWPYWEGNHIFGGPKGPDPPTFPMLEYPHDPPCAVIGGLVVRNPSLPSLDGRYLYGDRCVSALRSFVPHVATQQATGDAQIGIMAPGISGFGEGLAGQVYYAAGSGVYRITESP
jgi:glucose/arabinose dehydrogenase